MKKELVFTLIAVIAFTLVHLSGLKAETKETKEKPAIEMAILLDTSNSMDGLINQARAQLWKIVNELATAKRDGMTPILRVALYEYGNDNIASTKGYIRQVLPLTTDLDKVSEMLFALQTRGGDEYCGQVIQEATNELKWSKDPKTLKMIFIAGNEPFTQGTVDYTQSVKAAISKDITVNTIFCGPAQEGIATKWQDGALRADGKFMNIDQNKQVAYIEAPQDKEIAKLGAELNQTYIGYGTEGKVAKERQVMQDQKAQEMSEESAVQRTVSKTKGLYVADNWDLVDAVKSKKVDLKKVEKDALPEEMKNLKPEERQAYVEKKQKEREEIQKKITELNEQRTKYVNDKMKELNQNGENTLDAVMIKSIRELATKKNFSFETK